VEEPQRDAVRGEGADERELRAVELHPDVRKPPSLLLSEYPSITSCLSPREATTARHRGNAKSRPMTSLARRRSSIVSKSGTTSRSDEGRSPGRKRPDSFKSSATSSTSDASFVFEMMACEIASAPYVDRSSRAAKKISSSPRVSSV
jgi:hypothetical protein